MVFADVILKLLPFTFVNTEQKIEFGWWSELTPGDKIITGIEIALLLIFIYYLVKLFISFSKDRSQINIFSTLIAKYQKEGFVENYNDFTNELREKSVKLYLTWKEFDESLIKKEVNNQLVIKNSIDAEYFFNKSTMINHLGSKLFSAIPGVLLGIGLLGTFFGLYFALINLNIAGDSEVLKESIKNLINLAGVKFAASIWGLLLSVLFTLADKILEANLDTKLEKIQNTVNELFTRETAEQNLIKILEQNIQQSAALNGLATSLTEKISAELNLSFIPKIESMNSHFANLPSTLSHSLQGVFEKPLENLSDTIKNISSSQAEQSTDALKKIIETFVDRLDSAAGNQGESLKKTTEQSQEIMMSVSKHLEETFSSMRTMFDQQYAISKERDQKILDDLLEIKNSQSQMMQDLSSSVTTNIKELNTKVADSIEQLVKIIESTSRSQEESTKSSQESLSENTSAVISSAKKVIEQYDGHMQTMEDKLNHLLETMANEVDRIAQGIQKSADKIEAIPQYISNFGNSTEKLLDFGRDISTSSEKLTRFNDGFNESQTILNEYTQNLKQSSKELLESNQSINQTLITSKDLLKSMHTDFGDLAQDNSKMIDLFRENLERYMNEHLRHLDDAIKNRVIHPLDIALSSYAKTMGDAITNLADAIEELRTKSDR